MIYSNERGSVIDGINTFSYYSKIPVFYTTINGKTYWSDSEDRIIEIVKKFTNKTIKIVEVENNPFVGQYV